MKRRKLGTLEVSELGSGCMSISANYGPPADRQQGITVIREAHETGWLFRTQRGIPVRLKPVTIRHEPSRVSLAIREHSGGSVREDDASTLARIHHPRTIRLP